MSLTTLRGRRRARRGTRVIRFLRALFRAADGASDAVALAWGLGIALGSVLKSAPLLRLSAAGTGYRCAALVPSAHEPHETLGETQRPWLRADIPALIGRHNVATDRSMVVPSEYLEVVDRRRSTRPPG